MFDPEPVGDGLFAPGWPDADHTDDRSEAELLDRASDAREARPAGGRSPRATILLPYSGSESAEVAVDAAIGLFAGSACEVRVVHFREWIPSRAGPSFLFTPAQARRLVANAALRLRRAGLLTSAVVRDANHATVPVRILGEADDVGAHAIVLGARRRRAVTAAMLGSVSRRVTRASVRPVVLVHPPDARTGAGGGSARSSREPPDRSRAA